MGKPEPSVYDEIIRLSKELQDAEVPTDNRVMYYYVWSWWRHPIKRWKQKRLLKRLVSLDKSKENV